MKKILAIGNSFSEDATKYIHQLAADGGIDTKVVNLYIGGCSLERHWENIEKDKHDYQYQQDGTITERYVSVAEAISEENWDFIVTQQASHDSGWADTYEPFLGNIVDFLKKNAPDAEIILHETWAYEIGSGHNAFPRYHRNQAEMYARLSACYNDMAAKYGLRLIPCGKVLQAIRGTEPFNVQSGGMSLCRDGFHMSYLYGRFLLACVWTKFLLGLDPAGISYIPASVGVKEIADKNKIDFMKQFVSEMQM